MAPRTSALLGAAALCAALPASAQDTTLTIATVANPDMERMRALSGAFTAENPDVALEWEVLDENTLRQRVTTDIAVGGGRFDVVTIGVYEAPIWAERGWLMPLDALPESYDVDDLLPTIRAGLSHEGTLHAAPFYGESSFTMYRTDLFEAAGLQMPDAPSWAFLSEAAAAIDAMGEANGICLRGKPGWGENAALVTTMTGSYGARWFDEAWEPQLDGAEWVAAVKDYVALVTDHGPADAASNGYLETLALFQRGECAIWVDATVAASAVTDPEASTVADRVGFALAPDAGRGRRANWLWAWALAIPADSERQDAAARFVAWATSRAYAELVAAEAGWAAVPPGTRRSLYENPAYLEAAPFAELVLASIEAADPTDPHVADVPYEGIQYVAIPEYPGIGTAVGSQIAEALKGEISVEEALENAQWVAEKVIERARFIEGQ